ncbi:unnamed protein product [marine sediment metagenome]|uniref:Uncharacterized protein n=1 Tax=marine sediment metagenome TaxID=412755 RepID=X1IKL1_9ZZZZ
MLKDFLIAAALFLVGFLFVLLLLHVANDLYEPELPLNKPPQEMLDCYEDQLLKEAKIDE